LNIFDINIKRGYEFESHVRSIRSLSGATSTFKANMNMTGYAIAGSVSGASGQKILTGIGTNFISMVKPGAWLSVGDNIVQASGYGFSDIVLNTTHLLTTAVSPTPVIVMYNKIDRYGSLVMPLPNRFIRSVRNSSSVVSMEYSTKRRVEVTTAVGQTTGTINLTLPGETFPDTTIFVIDKLTGSWLSGATATLDSTQKVMTISGLVASTTYEVIVNVKKSGGVAAKEKTKTVNVKTITITGAAELQKSIYKLGVADAFNLIRVVQGSTDLTSNYELVSNVTATAYYGSFIVRKPGAAAPNNTDDLTIIIEYYEHSAGDYFSIDSYSNLPWHEVNEALRDSLDFRPRISDDETGFEGVGSSVTEHPIFDSPFKVEYSHYLPRRDFVAIDGRGRSYIMNGVPGEKLQIPKEFPDTYPSPSNTPLKKE
jgi:hypothetical protein